MVEEGFRKGQAVYLNKREETSANREIDVARTP